MIKKIETIGQMVEALADDCLWVKGQELPESLRRSDRNAALTSVADVKFLMEKSGTQYYRVELPE